MSELPKGWATATVAEITLPVFKNDRKNDPDKPIWYVDISSIDNQAQAIFSPQRLNLAEAPSRARQIIQAGDVLFSLVRPYLRKIAPVTPKYDGEVASTGFAVLRPANGIDAEYLFFKVISRDFVVALTEDQYGVSYPAVNEVQVTSRPVEVPPINEQRRIVSKIESLFAELDKGEESLRAAKARAGLYRQSLLKHAFEGHLTADWRAANPDKLEAPEILLARIQTERETRYKQALDDWQIDLEKWRDAGEQGKKPAKPKRPGSPSIIEKREASLLPNLPEDWVWVRLADCFWLSPKNGIYKPAEDYGSGVQIVRIDDFYDGRLTKREGFKRLRVSDREAQDFCVSEGQILINRVNSIEYLGKSALVKGLNQQTVFESNIMRCHPLVDRILANWLVGYLASRDGRNRICQNAKHAVNQASINQTDVGETLVPLCSSAEQAEIVSRLETKLSTLDALEAQIDAQLARSKALRQSILKQAFAGKLVAQDPNDEPASELLNRIKAEKAAAPKPKRKKKVKV